MRQSTNCNSNEHLVSRRSMLAGTVGALGFGSIAQPLVADGLKAKRKRLLLIFLSGGASQLETWGSQAGHEDRRAVSSHSYLGAGRAYRRVAAANRPDHAPAGRGAQREHSALPTTFSGTTCFSPDAGSPVIRCSARPPRGCSSKQGDVLPGYVSLRRDGPKAYTDVGDAGFLGPK